MKKVFSLLLALSLVLSCVFALAEETETCTYTIFNETGEKVTELYVTDNLTGEKSENFAGEEGLKKGGIVEISGTNKEGYVITLSFKTESGYEAAFETLHFETVPISLLPAGLYVTDNLTGEKSENLAGEGLENGASVEISGTNKPGYVITLSFTTESGYEAAFETLHFETVPISLLPAKTDTDATTGATPISFSAPEA